MQKFPNPLDYFYQNRGFCLAEAYYQSVQNPYQGLLVGEPLSAPFARPGTADWSSLTNGTVLSGQAGLNLTFSAAATNLPLARVDLFLDGNYIQTVTNLLPSASNVLSVTLNGVPVNYTVPTNATVASVATGLAAALNAQTNSTRVQAYVAGDRLELQSLDVAVPGSNVTLSASAAAGSAGQLTTLPTPARSAFLDTTATGYLCYTRQQHPCRGRLAPARVHQDQWHTGKRQHHQHGFGHHHCHARPKPPEPRQRQPRFAVRGRCPGLGLRRRHLLWHRGGAVDTLRALARLACLPNRGRVHRLDESPRPAVRHQPPPGQPHRPAAAQPSLRQLRSSPRCPSASFSTPPGSPTASIN